MNRVLSLPAETAEIAGETSSTLKAFGVLEVLVRAGRAVTLSELMQATDLPKPTLHRTLALFEEAGFLAREPGGRAYIIGERLSRFALDVLRSDAAAAQRRTILRAAVSEITETCNLAVLKKGALIYLDRVEAHWPLRLHMPEGGVALPPHCCASGKLLLAHLPGPERQGLLAVLPLERNTSRTITDRAVLGPSSTVSCPPATRSTTRNTCSASSVSRCRCATATATSSPRSRCRGRPRGCR